MSSLLTKSVDPANVPTPDSPDWVELFYNIALGSYAFKKSDGSVQTLSTGVTAEQVQDIVGAFIQQGTGITVNYDDGGNVMTIGIATVTFNKIESALQPGANISVLINDSNFQTDTQVTNAINNAIASQVIGDNYEDFEDLDTFSTTSNSFVTAYTFTTTVKQPGRYRIFFKYKYEPSATSDDDLFRLNIDSTEDNWENQVEGKDTGSDQNVPGLLLKHINFAVAGTHTIVVEVRQTDGGTTVCKGVRGEMWRVS